MVAFFLEREQSCGAECLVEHRIVVLAEGVEILPQGPAQEFWLTWTRDGVNTARCGGKEEGHTIWGMMVMLDRRASRLIDPV